MKYILISLFISNICFAEYRVYQYILKNEDPRKSEVFQSTLDPITFHAYHGTPLENEFELLRTWICPGHTANKDFCASPYKKLVLELI